VGASLLAKTSVQPTCLWLIHCFRKQARSHRVQLDLQRSDQTENLATILFKSTASRDNSWLAALV
jgi:hypothetical protein